MAGLTAVPPAAAAQAAKALESAAYHFIVNKYYSLAAIVLFAYDNLLTLDREVKVIWRAKWSAVKVLFLFNRYATILAYGASIVALHSNWPSAVCKRYVLFPGVFNLLQQMSIGAILMLFTYAIFDQNQIILGIILITYAVQIAVAGWSLGAVIPVPLPPGFTGCVFAGKTGTGIRVITAWIMQLVFISVVFTLMIWKAFQLRRAHVRAPLVEVLTKHGLKHFCVIFVVNLVNVLNFSLVKAKDLRSLHATFSALITVLMVDRLVLLIRQEADTHRYPSESTTLGFSAPAGSRRRPKVPSLSGLRRSSDRSTRSEAETVLDISASAQERLEMTRLEGKGYV